MPAIISDNFRVANAKEFIESISEDSIYLFIGKSHPWPNEGVPPNPTDSLQETEYTHWDDMIAAKIATSDDVVHMIPRVNWTTSTVYDQYDPTDPELHRKEFYVMNTNFRVYKCIDNNGGLPSTVEPTGTAAAIFTTADGYAWKYMYSVSIPDAVKFLTPQFLPVRNLASNTDNDGPGLAPYPPGGHGADNIKELGAYYVGMTIRLEAGEGGDFTTENDYRKIGLIKNPLLYGTTTVATDASYRQTTRLTVSAVTGAFLTDEEIEGASPSDTARVIEYDASGGFLYIQIISGSFTTSDGVTGQNSGATATISDVQDRELERYTGDILYIEQRALINRDPNQTEVITIIFQY